MKSSWPASAAGIRVWLWRLCVFEEEVSINRVTVGKLGLGGAKAPQSLSTTPSRASADGESYLTGMLHAVAVTAALRLPTYAMRTDDETSGDMPRSLTPALVGLANIELTSASAVITLCGWARSERCTCSSA